jgi:ornithine carbamoyltransferase
MELFMDPKFKKEKKRRIHVMMYHQVNSELLKDSEALIMHDMPIHRGYRISDEAVESLRSIVYKQSENRLYVANL